MRNIQVFDGAVNAVYDIFSATDEEFALIFPDGQDVAFIESMKMEVALISPRGGTVLRLIARLDEMVSDGAAILSIDAR